MTDHLSDRTSASAAPSTPTVHRPSGARHRTWFRKGGFVFAALAAVAVLRDPGVEALIVVLASAAVGGALYVAYLRTTTLTLDGTTLTRRRWGLTRTYDLGRGARGVLGLRDIGGPVGVLGVRDSTGRHLSLSDMYWDPEALVQIGGRTDLTELPTDTVHGIFSWARAGGDVLSFSQRRPGWAMTLGVLGLVVGACLIATAVVAVAQNT